MRIKWLTKITVTDEYGTRTLREYDYDELGKVTTIGEYLSDADGNITGYIQKNYAYDTFQRVASMSYKDGADKTSALTEREKYTYEYDRNSNIIKETLVNNYPDEEADRINRTKTYTYNGLGCLIKSVETDNATGTEVTTVYTYDANGNRLSMTEGSVTTTYQYNKLDQLTKAEEKNDGSVTATTVYSYDANGNQIKESIAQTGVENTYTYDVANRLTQATLKSATGTLVQNNIYNGSGQRIQKIEKLNGVTGTINYYYQDGVVLYTTDAHGEKTSHNLLGLSGNPIATRRYGDEDLYYTYNKDSKGSTTSLVNQPGNSVVTYTYTDFGETEIFGDTGFYNEICYTGGIYDSSTGLYYLNARYYNPEDGRFITQDSYRGDEMVPNTWHLYAYCANNPVNFVDPSGHKNIRITKKLNTEMKKNCKYIRNRIKDVIAQKDIKGIFDIYSDFVDKVRTKGKWDLKNIKEWKLKKGDVYIFRNRRLTRNDSVGNIHFGYVGSMLFPGTVLRIGAGLYQIKSGTWSWKQIPFWGYSYGDDPIDSMEIDYGHDCFINDLKAKILKNVIKSAVDYMKKHVKFRKKKSHHLERWVL